MRAGVIWAIRQFEQAYERNRPEIPGQPTRGHGGSPEGPHIRPVQGGKASPHRNPTVTPENRCTAILEGRTSRTMGFWLKS